MYIKITKDFSKMTSGTCLRIESQTGSKLIKDGIAKSITKEEWLQSYDGIADKEEIKEGKKNK